MFTHPTKLLVLHFQNFRVAHSASWHYSSSLEVISSRFKYSFATSHCVADGWTETDPSNFILCGNNLQIPMNTVISINRNSIHWITYLLSRSKGSGRADHSSEEGSSLHFLEILVWICAWAQVKEGDRWTHSGTFAIFLRLQSSMRAKVLHPTYLPPKTRW